MTSQRFSQSFPNGRWIAPVCLALTAALGDISVAVAQGGRYEGTTEAGQAFARGQAAASEGDRLLQDGESDDAMESYEEAAEAYQEALELDEEFDDARERLGYVFYVMGRSQDAVELLQEGLELNPTAVGLRRMLGINLYELDERDEAVSLLQDVDNSGGATPDVLFILGKHFYEAEDYDTAVGYLQRYLSENPSDAAAHGALGNAYLRSEQYELALAEFRTVLELDPDNGTAKINMGDVYFATEDWSRAVELYEQVLTDENDNYRVWFNVGKSYIELARFDDALNAFDRLLELRDDPFQAHYYRGVALLELDRASEARGSLERAIDLNDDHALSHYRLGLVLLAEDEVDGAEASLRRACALEPDEPWFAVAMGDAFRRLGRTDEAIEVHEAAIGHDATQAGFHESLGRDYYAATRLDDAVASLEQSLALEPGRETAAPALTVTLLTRAQQAMRDEQLEAADDDLRRAQQLDTHPLETAVAMVTLALLRDDPASAEIILDSVRAFAETPVYRRARAYLDLAGGNPTQVAVTLADIADQSPSSMEPLEAHLLGHAAAATEDWPRAAELFRRALEADEINEANLARVYLHQGIRAANRGGWDAARSFLDDAARLGTHLDTLDETRMEYVTAVTELNLGNFDSAGRHFSETQRLLERLSDSDRNHLPSDATLKIPLRLAYSYYRIDDLDQTIVVLESAPRDSDTEQIEELLTSAHERLAQDAYDAGDLSSARRHLEQAIESAPRNAAARNNLACLLYGEGERDEAGDIFQELADDGSIVNAIYNYAIYLDDVQRDAEGAYRYYRIYLERNGEESEQVRDFVRIKEEVFGFEPEG